MRRVESSVCAGLLVRGGVDGRGGRELMLERSGLREKERLKVPAVVVL